MAAIIAVDLVLAGDNAVVIALAARRLPPELQKRAVIAGTFGAVLARVVLVFFALWLLEIPGLSIGGGLLLFYVAWRLAASDDNEQTDNRPAAKNFWQAMRTIIIADIVMGLDNILAIAGASRGNFELVVIGFALSVPIMIGGSVLILRLMKKAPWLVTAGAALLIAIAMRMILDDNLIGEHFPKQWEWPAVIAGALLFTIVIVLLQKRGADDGGDSPVTTVTEKGESQGGNDKNTRDVVKRSAARVVVESDSCQIAKEEKMTKFKLQFPEEDIPEIAARWDTDIDKPMLALRPNVCKQGRLTLAELQEVADWLVDSERGQRNVHIAKNTEEEVVAITSEVLLPCDDAHKQWQTLCKLHGVGPSVASTVLHWFAQGDFPIATQPALRSCSADGLDFGESDAWIEYTQFCRDLAARHKITMRTLDRALRQYDIDRRAGKV